MARPPIAVAVVSWNTRELLSRCLKSLAPEANAARADVWVVDNASTDGSPELVRDEFPWARLHESRRNLGFGAAVNVVAGRTRAPWLAPANADVEVRPGALDALLAVGDSHAAAGAIAPRLVLPDGSTQHSVYPLPTVPFAAAFALGAHRLAGLGDRWCVPGHWDASRPRRVGWAVGAFLLVRREAWDAVGGFDPAQWMYAEDLDLGWRLGRAGWVTRYEPAAEVVHHQSAATRQAWGEARDERWMHSTYEWMRRRRGGARTAAFAGANVIGAGVRWVALAAAAGVRPQRYAAPRDEMRGWAARHLRAYASSSYSAR